MKKSKSTRSFTGTSLRGDLTEALGDALTQVSGPPDFSFKWTIEKISGRSGGIAGLKQISVTIAVEI
jgi:hypothetical protein